MFPSSKLRRIWRRLARLPRGLFAWLVGIGRRLTAPVDALSERSVAKVSALADGFNKLESLAVDAAVALTRPFRFLARIPWMLLIALVSPRRLAAIGKPFRRLGRRLHGPFVWLAEALFIDRFFIGVARITKPLWYPIAALGGFVVAWWQTRKFRRLVWGVPLFVLLLPLTVLAGWFVVGGRSGIAANYRAAITDARTAKDYARLLLLERKLAQMGIDTQRTEFNSIIALEQDGQLREAYDRAQRLANRDDLGYAPAHLWIVEHLLTKKLSVPAEEAPQLIEQHLNALAQLGMKGREINILRGLALVQQKRLREAAELFQPLVDEVPIAAIQQFQIDLELQQIEDARRDALAVRRHLERQRKSGVALRSGDYQCWANAERFLNDSSRFRAVLNDWLKAEPQNVDARRGMAAIFLAEFDDNLRSPQPDDQLLAKLLLDAFAVAEIPDDSKLRVVALYRQKSTSTVLHNLFEQLGHSNNVSASLAELLGTVAGVEGEWSQAESWMRQAVAKDERRGVAWNNLACILLQKGDSKALDEALAAANRAVALAPEDYRFRETRGQIYLRLKHLKEAVNDLEYALNGMPEAAAVHRSLAAAYDELGDKQLAAQHRSQSQ